MMSYCTLCGAEMHSSSRRTCDLCVAKQEASATANVESPAVKHMDMAMAHVHMLRDLFMQPSRTMQAAASHSTVVPGLAIAGISLLLLSIASGYFLGKMVSLFLELMGPFGALAFGIANISNAATVMIRAFFFFMMGYAAFSLILLGMVKAFKGHITPVQAFNITGIASGIVGISAILAMGFSMVHILLGSGIILMGLVHFLVAVQEGTRPLLAGDSFDLYLVPAVVSLFYVGMLFLGKVLIF